MKIYTMFKVMKKKSQISGKSFEHGLDLYKLKQIVVKSNNELIWDKQCGF